MTTLSHVDELRSAVSFLSETLRYDALYTVDRESLADMLEVCIPVLHLGQVEAVKAVTAALPPATQRVTVWLWCPRHVALALITERSTGDTAARLRAWDETAPLPEADISINTAELRPTDANNPVVERFPAQRPRGKCEHHGNRVLWVAADAPQQLTRQLQHHDSRRPGHDAFPTTELRVVNSTPATLAGP